MRRILSLNGHLIRSLEVTRAILNSVDNGLKMALLNLRLSLSFTFNDSKYSLKSVNAHFQGCLIDDLNLVKMLELKYDLKKA